MIRAPCAQALPALKWLRGPLPEPENNGVQKSPPQRMALRDGTAACCREPAFGRARAPRWPCARLRGGVSSGRWVGSRVGWDQGWPPLCLLPHDKPAHSWAAHGDGGLLFLTVLSAAGFLPLLVGSAGARLRGRGLGGARRAGRLSTWPSSRTRLP